MTLRKIFVTVFAALATASPFLERRQCTGGDGGGEESNSTSFEDTLSRLRNLSLTYAIANIGGTNDSRVANGPDYNPGPPANGSVVASPSTYNPDYFYTWTRDSALTMLMLTDELIFGTETDGNNSLATILDQYITAQAILQTRTNPSGTFYPAGQGLGEPKFYSNLTRYDGTWGRTQNDGPALRASTLMEYADYISGRSCHALDHIRTVYWPIILNDLKYVGQYWNSSSYDLWEEVNGNSFFTTTAQLKSLVQGARWAERLGQECLPCREIPEIMCFLQTNFWNETGGYISANINTNQVNRSEINVDPLLAASHVFDIDAPCDSYALQPCSSKILATHKAVVDSFRNLYPINNNATAPAAVLVGRYPEDTYYSGNPWYITTYEAAQVLYEAVAQMNRAGSYDIDNYSLPFFQDLYPNATIGTVTGTELANITGLITTYADGFINLTLPYISPNGSISEQINKTTGEQLSAAALTWSFAAFITAYERRSGQYPPSWGANSTLANIQSRVCSWSSWNSTFTYTPAVAAAAAGGGDNTPIEPETYTNSTPSCLTEILFEVNVTTQNGQNVYIKGDQPVLGNSLNDTSTDPILPIRTNNITQGSPTWFVDLWFPAAQVVEYQYLLQNASSGFIVENNGSTRLVTAPECGAPRLFVNDSSPDFGLSTSS